MEIQLLDKSKDEEVLIHNQAQMIRVVRKNMAFVVLRTMVFMVQCVVPFDLLILPPLLTN